MIAIKTEELTKHYGTVKALNKLNLEVPENVVFGFLGPNGAGKSTTIKLLTAFAQPTSGRAFVAGEKVTSSNLALKSKIGFLPDVPAFYDWMTGREFLHLVGELYRLSVHELKNRAEEMLDLVDLKKAGNRRIGGYSRGMRQRLGIAQALINHPKVVFMDEPTSALDPIGRREVLELVSRLKQTATVFMSTHILSDVERVCDMVGIINKGNLIAVSSVSDLQKQYAHSVFEMEFLEPTSLGFFEKTPCGGHLGGQYHDAKAIVSAIFVARADTMDGADSSICKRKNRPNGLFGNLIINCRTSFMKEFSYCFSLNHSL